MVPDGQILGRPMRLLQEEDLPQKDLRHEDGLLFDGLIRVWEANRRTFQLEI